MNPKLGDLALNVIEFFGILVPGMVFTALQADLLLGAFTDGVVAPQRAGEWLPTLLVAYIVGHMLLGLSVWLNAIAARIPEATTTAYFEAVKGLVTLPPTLAAPSSGKPGVSAPTRGDVFYAAFSYIRLESAAALTEIERQAAEYKLFRSLTFLFMLDLGLTAVARPLVPARLIADALLIALCFYRFQFLHDWCQRLVFDFFLQLRTRQPHSVR